MTKSKYAPPFFMIILFFLLLDFYVFLKIWKSFKTSRKKRIFTITYWAVTGIIYVLLIIMFSYGQPVYNLKIHVLFYHFAGLLLLIYIPKIIVAAFCLVCDFVWMVSLFFHKIDLNFRKIYSVIRITGMGIAVIPVLLILYGYFIGRHDFRTEHITLSFKNLPESFDNLKIVHISDIHLGSLLFRKEMVKGEFERINQLEPDLILFTGDMVNSYSGETKGWSDIFNTLDSRYGIYSVLGNHDYGLYFSFEDSTDRKKDVQKLIEFQENAGFDVLLNESKIITKNHDSLVIIGVENWSKPPFPQYGDLSKARQYQDSIVFEILLTHDPSHWNMEVAGKKSIELTLAGHTHGAQFGIEMENWQWSPVKYLYPQWGGLYEENNQFLYVNRGFGYIGPPLRVGIRPEITVIRFLRK